LNQDIQYVAILIYSSPQIMNTPIDAEEYFIEVPTVGGPRRPAAQSVGVGPAESEAPFSDRLISEDDAAHSHHFFDLAEAERESGSRARPQ
jgi:hypothetical protein